MRIGVDVGGTFTDVILAAEGEVTVAKVPTRRDDQARGVLHGIDVLEVDPARIERFAHGTTVSTNTVLERDGARTVLVTTEGFRDLLEIGRQDRPSLYDLGADRAPPLVPRERVVEAPERIAPDGVVTPLDDPAAVAAAVARLGPEAVAVCLLFSFLDDGHERAIAEALRAAAPEVPLSLSSDVLPVFREYERASTTALNAYVAPRTGSYLARLSDELAGRGLSTEVEVMRSSGGTFTAEMAGRYPVHTLLSGPAAGAWGAAAVARASGHEDVIAFDMGGTSTDVTLIEGGRPGLSAEGRIGELPFAVRSTDIHTIGAGGGSIAWADPGGALRVGPRSAGAEPGPAAYGRGGTEPTVTDAHVVLGRLAADAALGSDALRLDTEAARSAVASLAEDLGTDVGACAAGIVEVAEAAIVRALRVVSVERGRDPRGFALLAYGGAGPLHQAGLSRELGCPTVLVPPHAGVLAALGLLAAPRTADALRTHLTPLGDLDGRQLEDRWSRLEREASARLEAQGAPVRTVTRTAECRYAGQAHELEIAPEGSSPAELADLFHATHDERYGYAQRDETVEVVNLRVSVEGPAPQVPLPPPRPRDGSPQQGVRTLVVDGDEHTCPVYARARLGTGDRIDGPALVAGLDTTCLIAPGQSATVDDVGCLVITWTT